MSDVDCMYEAPKKRPDGCSCFVVHVGGIRLHDIVVEGYATGSKRYCSVHHGWWLSRGKGEWILLSVLYVWLIVSGLMVFHLPGHPWTGVVMFWCGGPVLANWKWLWSLSMYAKLPPGVEMGQCEHNET